MTVTWSMRTSWAQRGGTTEPMITDTTTAVFGHASRMCTAFYFLRNDYARLYHTADTSTSLLAAKRAGLAGSAGTTSSSFVRTGYRQHATILRSREAPRPRHFTRRSYRHTRERRATKDATRSRRPIDLRHRAPGKALELISLRRMARPFFSRTPFYRRQRPSIFRRPYQSQALSARATSGLSSLVDRAVTDECGSPSANFFSKMIGLVRECRFKGVSNSLIVEQPGRAPVRIIPRCFAGLVSTAAMVLGMSPAQAELLNVHITINPPTLGTPIESTSVATMSYVTNSPIVKATYIEIIGFSTIGFFQLRIQSKDQQRVLAFWDQLAQATVVNRDFLLGIYAVRTFQVGEASGFVADLDTGWNYFSFN